MNIQPQLQEVFLGIFGDGITVTRKTTAQDIEGWDSVQHVKLVLEVEKRFGVRFSISEIAYCRNVGDLEDLIARKTAGATQCKETAHSIA